VSKKGVADVWLGSIAADAVRVLQRRMSVAPRKRQLANKLRHVVKGQKRSLLPVGGGSAIP
jgi:hypothetical protein